MTSEGAARRWDGVYAPTASPLGTANSARPGEPIPGGSQSLHSRGSSSERLGSSEISYWILDTHAMSPTASERKRLSALGSPPRGSGMADRWGPGGRRIHLSSHACAAASGSLLERGRASL